MKESAGHRQFLFHTPAPFANLFLTPVPHIKVGKQLFDTCLPFGGRASGRYARINPSYPRRSCVHTDRKTQERAAVGANIVCLRTCIKAQHPSLAPSWFSRPNKRCIVVVFPAPLGPRNPKIIPGNTTNERSSTRFYLIKCVRKMFSTNNRLSHIKQVLY